MNERFCGKHQRLCELCTGHKSDGSPCGAHPIKGGTVCRVHGGSAPAVRAAAQRRLETEAVAADLSAVIGSEGLGGVSDPLDALARLATEAMAMKTALAARVNALNSLSYKSAVGTEQIRAEVLLYERAIDRSAKFLDLLAKSGFEERRVRIDEATGQHVGRLIQRILQRLELSDHQRRMASPIVIEEIQTLRQEITV